MKEIININLQTFKINSVLDSTLPQLKLQFPDSQAPRYSRVTAHRLELQAQGSGSNAQIQRDRVKDLKQYPLIHDQHHTVYLLPLHTKRHITQPIL